MSPPRSIRTQLQFSIVTMMTMLVLMQCVATLRFTIEDSFKNIQQQAESIKEHTRLRLDERIRLRLASQKPVPATFEDAKKQILDIVGTDDYLPNMLLNLIANSRGVIEIQLCDDAGLILASSSKHHSRMTYVSLPLFEEWREQALLGRIYEVIWASREYALVVPLVYKGDSTKRILDIRVVVGSILIRDDILKQVKTLAAISGLSLLATAVFAYLFSNFLHRWLNSIAEQIDSLSTGEFTPAAKVQGVREPKEIADMTSKLEVLGRQYKGAREDMVQLSSNIDGLLERLEEGVVLFGPDGHVIRASRSIEGILGVGQGQLLGKHIEALFPKTTALGGLLDGAIKTQAPVREQSVVIERPGNAPLRLLANADLIEGSDRRSSLLLTLRDIETRRELRTQIDISTRLAAISRLTGGVAHEIKNPLNAMSLHLENLRGKLNGEGRVQEELGVIGGEIARLDRVVKTFLDFTRPVDLKLKPVDLVALCRQVAQLVWPGRGAVTVELDARTAKAWVRADEDSIKQALINVVNNGVEAMEKGKLSIRVDAEGDQVVVSVIDQGQGIPRELQDRIFNLYFTTKEKGSGIGLAMTFQIVQLHGGTVDFSSEPGQGTTFRLNFPASKEVFAGEQNDGA